MSQPMVPPTPPAGSGGAVSQNRTIMIVLSYFGLLALIPLLVEKDDREVQWHAKHGLVLFVAEIIIATLISVVHILAIVKGVNGQRLIIPGLSDFANRF